MTSWFIGPDGAREVARQLGGFRTFDSGLVAGFVAHWAPVWSWNTEYAEVMALTRYIEARGKPVFRCRVRRRKISWRRARELVNGVA